ncbi:MAG: hypothetical protein P4L50_24400, partial [Anaerolineaceae bacterium]|nr:hypothetical protein [Anaerolineaceae bacterium]
SVYPRPDFRSKPDSATGGSGHKGCQRSQFGVVILACLIPLIIEMIRKLFFLVRNEQAAVTWAYPVTVEPTPHRLKFNSGEQLYAA